MEQRLEIVGPNGLEPSTSSVSGRAWAEFSNPQPNSQNAMSGTSCAYLGSPRGCLHGRGQEFESPRAYHISHWQEHRKPAPKQPTITSAGRYKLSLRRQHQFE